MKTLVIQNLPSLPYAAEEALNRLQINFTFCGDQFKKVVVTSSTPEEGKSTVSINLWRLLAASGKRVVLVDADMRKSVMRSRYQITSSEHDYLGLSHYLAGKASLVDVLYSTNINGGYMVPTSHTVSNPTVLLQNGRLQQMLDLLAQKFDYVLVDTSPLVNVADGNLIASNCNGAILVVRGGVTPRKLVADSLKQLERAECKLMGVVLNRITAKDSPYYQKYKKAGYYSNYAASGESGKR